jgi:hypothetical protein
VLVQPQRTASASEPRGRIGQRFFAAAAERKIVVRIVIMSFSPEAESVFKAKNVTVQTSGLINA